MLSSFRTSLRLNDCSRFLSIQELRSVFLACETDWYKEAHSFREKNEAFCTHALNLSKRAGAQALESANLDLKDYGALVFVTSTGIATPSLDATLIQELDLPRDILRSPLWGLGCAGGASGLAQASILAKQLQKPVLLIATELCSLTFAHGDRSKSNLVATALFGDGSAALVVDPVLRPDRPPAPRLTSFCHRLLDGSQDVMGWELAEDGLRVQFARSVPHIVERIAPEFVTQAASGSGLSLEGSSYPFQHAIFHPGGQKVLDAYERSLNLLPDSLDSSKAVLHDYGNMSSPTVLFVLKDHLERHSPTDAPGLLMALGPGFSAAGCVLWW